MALNLSGLFYTNGSDMRTDTVPSRTDTTTNDGGRPQTPVQTGSLEPGQTISGEIVGKSGNEIQIRIARDVVVNARMDQEIAASTGQNVTFEVRSQSSGVINLRPLFWNMSQESTALKALSQAGIEANGRSMQMIFSMMSEGMSIGKEAVQDMYQQVAEMPEADVTAIVQMNRLGIPVTPENLQQFTAYKNYEHQLLSAFSQVAEEIPQAVMDLFATGGPGETAAFIDQLLTIFAGKEGQEAAAGDMTSVSGQQVLEDVSILEEGEGQETEQETAVRPEGEAAGKAESQETAQKAASEGQKAAVFVEEEIGETLDGQKPQETAQTGKAGTEQASAVENAVPKEEQAKLAALVKGAGGSEELIRQLQQGELGEDELYRAVRELSRQAQSPEQQAAVKDLFLSKPFQKVLQDKISNQWTLTSPEEVEKKEVARLYDRLNEQTRALTRALSETARTDSPLFRSVQNIRENVDFMNQLNQMYAYVQLPLKFKGQNAHGDLYVYTNKKNLARKDGNVSAFLHLDMSHLGRVDVYVAMERGRINTNFYLADEASLDLLEKNIDRLTQRLTEKGYHAETKLMLKEDQDNVMEEIIKTDRNISVVSDLSFDVRA